MTRGVGTTLELKDAACLDWMALSLAVAEDTRVYGTSNSGD